jgi:hypothetical protein
MMASKQPGASTHFGAVGSAGHLVAGVLECLLDEAPRQCIIFGNEDASQLVSTSE